MLASKIAPRRFVGIGALNWGTAVVNGIFGHVVPALLTSSYTFCLNLSSPTKTLPKHPDNTIAQDNED